MISKLPRWARFGSAALAFVAGTINTVGLLGFQHQGITHLTGSTTALGIAVADGNAMDVAHFSAVIGFFVAGSVLGGVLIQDSALKLGRRYGVALFVESALLFACIPLLQRGHNVGAYLASCACGLQNGMVSTYSGAVLRTTHVSGIFTDLGILIGHYLRRIPVDARRIRLCLLLLTSFFGGSVAGAFGFSQLAYATLYFPAVLTGCVGGAYLIFLHRQSQGHAQ